MFFKNLFTFLKPQYKRRRYPRVEAEFILRYKVRDAEGFDYAQCKNISVGGLLIIEINQHLLPGTFVDLELSIPAAFDSSIHTLKLLAQVVHCEAIAKKKDRFNCGIKFLETSEEERKLLERYISYIQRLTK